MKTDLSQALTGKVAVVTGAGRGIGRAIAEGYARAGARVVCTARSVTDIEEVAQAITRAGGTAVACQADVTDSASMDALFARAASEFGGVDIVIANAGVLLESQPVEMCDPHKWMRTFEVNVFGVFHTARAAIPHLRQRGGGKIVVIGSGTRLRASAGQSAYASSKLAAWMLTQTLAVELEEASISVNELIPGPVKTAMTGFGQTRFPRSEWIKDPEDVVPMALFLATQPLKGPTAQSYSLMRRAE